MPLGSAVVEKETSGYRSGTGEAPSRAAAEEKTTKHCKTTKVFLSVTEERRFYQVPWVMYQKMIVYTVIVIYRVNHDDQFLCP